MRVFLLEFCTNDYQSLVVEDEGVFETGLLDMKCQSKESGWRPPRVRIYNPRLKKADLLRLCSGAMVLSARACDLLRTQLEMAGELLPIHRDDGEGGFLLNILECANCLDHTRTEWIFGKESQKPIRITRHVFIPGLLPESSLFKIPERLGSIYVSEGVRDPEDEFKHQVEAYGLEGIRFKLVWESEDL